MTVISRFVDLFQVFGSFCRSRCCSVKDQSAQIENIALGIWIIAVFSTVLFHEMWRDETREYLMAVGTDTLADYFAFAKYDGHPLLWRTILMVAHRLIPHPVVLQMASLVIGYFAVYLFVKKSPFPLVIRIIFIFGVIPFSTDAVDARDYGITMLLFFTLAHLYPKREQHPLLMGIILFFQANSNQYGMYLSGLFLAGWIADSGFTPLKDKRVILAACIALAGILLSFYSTKVDAESIFCPPGYLAKINWHHVFLKAFRHPGEFIYYILGINKVIFRDIFIVALIAAVAMVRPYLGFTLFFATFFFNIVGQAFIYPQTRHQGVLLGFFVTLLWITVQGLKDRSRPGLFKHADKAVYGVIYLLLLPFLIHQVQLNMKIVEEEAKVEKSCALAAGHFLRTNGQLKDAILIGSPDFAIEPISYYSGNRMYLYQEKVFRNFVKFARQFDEPTNLMMVLDCAEKLYAEQHVPIVIVLGHFGMVEGSIKPALYRGWFNINGVETFKEKTLKLVEFNTSLGDENYQLFLYLPPDELQRYRDKYMNLR